MCTRRPALLPEKCQLRTGRIQHQLIKKGLQIFIKLAIWQVKNGAFPLL